MKIALNQNKVGQFNMLGNEESLAFSIKLVDDDGNIVERDGVKCVARLHTDDDPQWKSDELADLYERGEFDEIARQCLEGEREVPCTKAFIATYIENVEELRNEFEASRKTVLEKQISALQEKLQSVKMSPAHYEMAELIKGLSDTEREKAARYRKWQEDYKESSESYIKWSKRADESDAKAVELEQEYEALYKKCEEYSSQA